MEYPVYPPNPPPPPQGSTLGVLKDHILQYHVKFCQAVLTWLVPE